MKNASPEVDAYIAAAPEFARPILTAIRRAFHKAEPEIVETIKWRFPHFEHKGVVGSMAAFKQHVNWGFWKASQLSDPEKIIRPMSDDGRVFGMKLTDASQLPAEATMLRYIREAVQLNETKAAAPKATPKPRRVAEELPVPPELAAALAKNNDARKNFEAGSPSHRREYILWIAEAKQDATRAKRVATAVEWLAEGKARNWKYERK